MAEVVIIAAVARNRVIGKDNRLLWNIPEDMAHFKTLTAGHTVVMGRKTWESLPARFRPLPNRRNIVISRQADFAAPGAEVADSLENALKLASTATIVFIIGGEQIYRQAMAVAHRLEITEVDIEPEGDAWFPEIDSDVCEQTESSEGAKSATGIGFRFTSWRIWSHWRPFPNPVMGDYLIAPFGPGVYELRIKEGDCYRYILRGKGKNCAYRMTSLLPPPLGQGTRRNNDKQDFVLNKLQFVEYRCIACKDELEAASVESKRRNTAPAIFNS